MTGDDEDTTFWPLGFYSQGAVVGDRWVSDADFDAAIPLPSGDEGGAMKPENLTDHTRWWSVEHVCAGVRRVYPILHWADEPEVGAGPRQAFECDACGDCYAFRPETDR